MNFSTQLLNESFNKILNTSIEEDIETTEDSLRHALEDARDTVARKNLHGFPEMKAYEVAFQNVIESFYPDLPWWDVTTCQIFDELLNSGCDANAVINCIMDNLTIDDANESMPADESPMDESLTESVWDMIVRKFPELEESCTDKLDEDASEDDKLVIYKVFGKYKVTPQWNYNARVQNARQVKDASDFNDAQEIVDYYNKYFDTTDDDFIIKD